MKKLFLLIVLILLVACAGEKLPEPKPQPAIPQIEIVPPGGGVLPEKPQYEPPPSEPEVPDIANAT